MAWQNQPRGEQNELPDVLGPIRDFIGRRGMGRLALIILGILILLWLSTGVYSVGPAEKAVVLTFGSISGVTASGLNYRFPNPIQSHTIVNVTEERNAQIGVATTPQGQVPVLDEALMLTGDENIVQVELFVRYIVRDPELFLYRVRDPEAILHNAAEVALRAEVGQHTIEFTQTEGRDEVADAVQERIQVRLDLYQSGIQVTEVGLLAVEAPEEVRDAFLEVTRAFEDQTRIIRESEAYQARVVPEARGEAAKMLQEADGYRQRVMLTAEGNADRFLRQLAEYRNAPEVTRVRLYLESIERALANAEKFILDVEGGGVNPFLPLRPLIGGNGGASPPPPTPVPAPQGGQS